MSNRAGSVNSPVLTIGEVADALELSVERLRQLANEGQLPAMRTSYGVRLFNAEDVRALMHARRDREMARRSGNRQRQSAIA